MLENTIYDDIINEIPNLKVYTISVIYRFKRLRTIYCLYTLNAICTFLFIPFLNQME